MQGSGVNGGRNLSGLQSLARAPIQSFVQLACLEKVDRRELTIHSRLPLVFGATAGLRNGTMAPGVVGAAC